MEILLTVTSKKVKHFSMSFVYIYFLLPFFEIRPTVAYE